MTHTPKNILVTGSAGFIGANFVRYLLAHDDAVNVVSLDKLTYAGNKNHLPNDVRHHFVRGDIGDMNLVTNILKKYNVDTIVHFAAESHVDRSINNPRAFIETNVLGTLTLLQCAREKNCRFHHISTDEVYGSLQPNDPAFTEKTAYQPNSPYSASKAGSDHLVRAFGHTYGLPVTISNCSNNYGPYQHAEKLIPMVINACLQQKPIPVYGNGSNIRDWIFVDDHCEAIYRILRNNRYNQTYNIGGECEINNIDLVETICTLMDAYFPEKKPHKSFITFVTDRPGHDWRYAINNHKIKTTLGWKPKTNLTAGLEKTIDFYVKIHENQALVEAHEQNK